MAARSSVSIDLTGNARINGLKETAKDLKDVAKVTAEADKEFAKFAQNNQFQEAVDIMQSNFTNMVKELESISIATRSAGADQSQYAEQAKEAFKEERKTDNQTEQSQYAKQAREESVQNGSVQNEARQRNIDDNNSHLIRGDSDGKSIFFRIFGGAQNAEREKRTTEINRLIQEIEKLTDNIDDLNEKYDSQKDTAQTSDDFRNLQYLQNTRGESEREKAFLESRLKSLNAENNIGINRFLSFDKFAQALTTVGNITQSGYTYRTDIANGNYVGADRRQATSVAGNIGSTLTSTGLGTMLLPIPGARLIGGIMAGVGAGTNFISRIAEGKGSAEDAEAASYMNNFEPKYNASRVFNDQSSDINKNTVAANKMYENAAEAAKNTGLDTAEFLRLMTQTAGYGVNETTATDITRQAGLWTQETGADTQTLLKLQGTSERYNLGDKSIESAYAGLKASGMERGQFTEFLQGLQSVLENSISVGFTTSAEEVSQNLAMFARLSDNNPIWQGQQGAQKFTSMNSSLSQATGLRNTNDMIVYGALDKGGSYVDTMKAIEKGLYDKDSFKKIIDSVKKAEGDNFEAIIERIRGIYGLNYTQAEQVYLMSDNLGKEGYTEETWKKDMETVGIPDSKTESSEWKNYSNKIEAAIDRIGEGSWKENIEELKNTAKDYLKKSRKVEVGNPGKVTGDDYGKLKTFEKGTEVKTVDNILSDSSFKTMVNRGGLPEGYGGITYKNLTEKENKNWRGKKSGGNDNRDETFKTMFAQYAAIDDGKVSEGEMRKAMAAHDSKEMQEAYNSEDESKYISALEKMLTRLFGNLTVTQN